MKPTPRPKSAPAPGTEAAASTPTAGGGWFYGMAGLLVVEGVLLAVRYHWTVIEEARLGPVRGLIEPALPTALATALVAVTSRRRRNEGDAFKVGDSVRPSRSFLVAHLISFVGFARTIAFLVAGDLTASPYPDARLVARLFGDPWAPVARPHWLGLSWLLGLAALTLWVLAVFPPQHRSARAWRGWGPLLAGVGVGAASTIVGWLARSAWLELGGATLWIVDRLLRLVFPEVVCRPQERIVGTPSFTVWIAPACSGFEGIGLVLIFLSVYLWLDRRNLRFPRAFWLLPIGAALMWLANAVRITALVAVGVWVSPKAAARGFHAQAGWLALNAVALGLVAAAQQSRFAHVRSIRAASSSPTPAYLLPLLASVATGMITSALTEDFDPFYSLRVLASLAVLSLYRRSYAGLRWTWSWPAVAIGALVFLLWLADPLSAGAGTGAVSDGDAETGAPSALAELTPGWAAFWLIGRIVGSVLVGPLVEELAFRGYLLRRLIRPDFQAVPPTQLTWPALLISSALFGALHERWLAGMAAGVAYALAQRRRGRLSDAVLAHATTNGLLTLYALTTDDWSSWS